MSTPWHWHPRVSKELSALDHSLERLANFLGTPKYLIGQTTFIIVWVILNSVHGWNLYWDSYPYILLNLMFSVQAAYAAPIILYKQVRDSIITEAEAKENYERTKRIEASHERQEQALGRIQDYLREHLGGAR